MVSQAYVAPFLTPLVALTGAVLLAAPLSAAEPPSAEEIVTGLRAVAGNPPNVRASNAKGACVGGNFTPSAEAAGLSKASMFAGTVPVTARFAMGGGNPRIADTTKAASRGFSMRFEGAGADTSLVMVSTPIFFARTPEQMMGFITARLPGADGKPDAAKISAFSAANPETTRQTAYLNARPVPASWAGANYWAVTVYTLTNARGEATTVKFKAVPTAGELTLTDDEVKAKPANFYADDLRDRLAKAPVTFDLTAIVGQPGDPTGDNTAAWPEDRRTVKLGTAAVARIVPDATCTAFTFDPVPLPDGLAGPKDDPLFEIRSPTYAISLSGRQD